MRHLLLKLAEMKARSPAKRAVVELFLEDGSRYSFELKVKQIDIFAPKEDLLPRVCIDGTYVKELGVSGFYGVDYSGPKPEIIVDEHDTGDHKTFLSKEEEWVFVEDDNADFSNVGHTFEQAMRSLNFVDLHIDNDASIEDTIMQKLDSFPLPAIHKFEKSVDDLDRKRILVNGMKLSLLSFEKMGITSS